MRFRIDHMPVIDWDKSRDLDQQRWSPGSVIVIGTQADAERELRQHENDYGPEVMFYARQLPELDHRPEHACGSCGGDLRDRIGTEFACRCPVLEQVDRYLPRELKWVRREVVLVPGKAAKR